MPPNAPSKLGAAIVELCNDAELRQRMSAAARLRACAEFSLEGCADRYEAAYRTLMAGRDLGA